MEKKMEQTIPEEVVSKIGQAGIVAVLVIDDPEKAVPLAHTLIENGITGMELTLRTDSALESLKRIRKEVPEMLAGVGTIPHPRPRPRAAKEADASFGVAPGYNPSVLG